MSEAAKHVQLEIKRIKASTTNPRKTFNQEQLKELAESIKKHGVIVPVLVRKDGLDYELVAGERRLRAAKIAGLEEIPALVRDLTNEEALEIQVIENLQRADLHPLEEAEGYELLIKKHKYKDADEIAAKVGKSRSYIYGRMKLCALVPKARKAFYDELLSASTALLIARVPAALQEEALQGITGDSMFSNGGVMPYREAVEYIHENFTLQLDTAPFDTKAENLIPKCGACTTCPKRTGNQKELFPDIKRADVCTDPGCFADKKAAGEKLLQTAAKEKGHSFIKPEKAEQLFRGDQLRWNSPYVDLRKPCEEDSKKRTWDQLLTVKPSPGDILIAMDGQGKSHQLILKSKAVELLEASKASCAPAVKKKLQSETRNSHESFQKQQRAEKRKAEIAQRVVNEALTAVLSASRKWKLEDAVRLFVRTVMANVHLGDFQQRRKLHSDKAIENALSKAKGPDLVELLVDAGLDDCYERYGDGWKKEFLELCREAKVDVKALEKKHDLELQKEENPEKSAEKEKSGEKAQVKEGKTAGAKKGKETKKK